MGVEINCFTVSGNLTKDAELKSLPSGTPLLNFSIAVSYRYKQSDQWVDKVSYFNCQWFGKQCENMKQYLVKGQGVAIEGELRQDRWEKDGVKHDKYYIIVSKLKLYGSKSASVETTTGQGTDKQEVFVDDIPF